MPLKVADSNESKLDEILDEKFRRIIVVRFSKIMQYTNQVLNVFKKNTNK